MTMKKVALLCGSLMIAGLGLVSGCGKGQGPGTTNAPAAANTSASKAGSQPSKYFAYNGAGYTASTSLTQKWLKTDAASQSVTVSLQMVPNGLALNGYYHGFMEIDVPVGWNVTVNFVNKNPDMGGQIAIVNPKDVMKGSNVTPAIPGAMMQKNSGTGNQATGSFQFTPTKEGTYIVESIPTAQSGTWLWFRVTSKSSQPQVKVRK